MTTPAEQTPALSEFETRIAQLTGQKAEAERGNAALEQTVLLLQKQNQVFEQRLNDVLIGQRPPAQETPALVPSGIPSSTPSAPAQSGDIAKLVASLVQDAVGSAIKPLIDDRAADTAANRLAATQNASLGVAAKQYPQLNDPESVLAKTAERIWASRPDLQGLEDGPLVVASLAASALASSKEQKAQNAPGKLQASTTPGNQSARDQITSILNDSDSTVEKLREGAAEVAERNQAEGVRGNQDGANRIRDVFRAQLNTIAADAAEAME